MDSNERIRVQKHLDSQIDRSIKWERSRFLYGISVRAFYTPIGTVKSWNCQASIPNETKINLIPDPSSTA